MTAALMFVLAAVAGLLVIAAGFPASAEPAAHKPARQAQVSQHSDSGDPSRDQGGHLDAGPSAHYLRVALVGGGALGMVLLVGGGLLVLAGRGRDLTA